jgi:GMP synthase (glutamine-hydrolysing)
MSRRSAVAIRHVAFEDLGLLAPILVRNGWTVSYVEAPTDDLSCPDIELADLLIVLGGPIGVYESVSYPFLSREITLLERRLAKGQSTLGICLGSQLMAAALGARVFPGPTKEIGWGRLKLTNEGRKSCLNPLDDADSAVLHWHGDTFDLPDGAIRLASNAHYDNQAFAYGAKALAVQFHIEADPTLLEGWYVGHAAELMATKIPICDLRTATASIETRARLQADRISSEWLGGLAVNA